MPAAPTITDKKTLLSTEKNFVSQTPLCEKKIHATFLIDAILRKKNFLPRLRSSLQYIHIYPAF